MKILFLSHYFPPEVNAPAKRTFEHAKIFAEDGHDVTVITNFPNHPHGKFFEGYKNKLNKTELIDGIKIIRVLTYATPNKNFFKRSINFSFFMFFSIINGIKLKNTDVILATSPQLLCGLSGMLLSKIKKTFFIFEIRDIWPESILAVNVVDKNSYFFLFLKLIEKKIIKSAHLIVAVTLGIKKYAEEMKHPNVKLITNGAHISKFSPVSSINKKKFTFAYVGTIGLAHNLNIIIRAASHFKENNNVKFLIVGDGAKKENIFNKAKKMKNIQTMSILFQNEFDEIFKEIDVGIVTLANKPLWKDALPSKIFDFYLRSKPIILSIPFGSTSRMIQKNKCGLVSDPSSTNDLIKNINNYIKNPKLIEDHGYNGRRLLTKKFDREILGKKLLQNTKDLIA